MGALQEIFTTRCSNDIVCATGSAWLPYEEWIKKVSVNYTGKSGPITTTVIGRTEVDKELNELGVIQRVRSSVADSVRVDHRLPISDIRKISAPDKKLQQKKSQMNLQPKNLTVDDLQECVSGDIKHQEIMQLYGFTSERYFKEVLKAKGYKLFHDELWVVKDRLWLE